MIIAKGCSNSPFKTPPVNFIANNPYLKGLFCVQISLQKLLETYTLCMKKILSTFLTLFCFVFILILPVFLWLHSNMMHHHDMSAWDCIEHCLSWEILLHSSKITFVSNYVEVLVSKVLFTKVFELIIPLVWLYVLLTHAPPNLFFKIKNYNYSSLIGIIKLTT